MLLFITYVRIFLLRYKEYKSMCTHVNITICIIQNDNRELYKEDDYFALIISGIYFIVYNR